MIIDLIMSANARMLDFLSKSIKEKEADLECPVCMETAEIPIFMCQVSPDQDDIAIKTPRVILPEPSDEHDNDDDN